MAFDLSEHPYFETWADPETGVESFILTKRVAPLQKGFYYTTPGMSADGRWLWFYAAWPPVKRWTLAAVALDPKAPEIRLFPHAVIRGNPHVLPEGDAVYVPIEDGMYRLAYGDGRPEEMFRMPRELIGERYLFSLVTTTTVSADGRYIVLDSHIGNRWLLSLGEIATGQVQPLRWFFICHHHAMFSPTDPDLIMFGQGPWRDPITGDKGDMNVRVWLMDTKLTRYEPMLPDLWFNHNSMCCHEWWGDDGRILWCDYDDGVYEMGLEDRRPRLIWEHADVIHAHADRARRWFVGDVNTYKRKPCSVVFFEPATGREIAISSDQGAPDLPPQDWRGYHLDPHPQFSPDGRYIGYTTTVRGTVDVALAPVERIVEKLGG